MRADELNKEQLRQLKQRYYDEQHDEQHAEGVSYGELAAIDELVSDQEVIEAYDGVDFVEDDFFN